MKTHRPTVRLHIWLEEDEDIFFGTGRAQLLDQIQRHGSIKKAAKAMGMSYRAAWGKIKATEKALGVQLVEYSENKRGGCRLSGYGELLRDTFLRWFDEVEQAALEKAEEIFPWQVKSFDQAREDRAKHDSDVSSPPDSPDNTKPVSG
jgi:molybdate transport system regulatory protein